MGQAETPIQSGIGKYLVWNRCLLFRVNGGGMKAQNRDGSTRYVRFGYWSALGSVDNSKGVPDFIGLVPSGRFFGFEVKPDGGKATKEQLACLQEIRDRGGIAAVVTSVDDVEKILIEEGEIEA